MSADALDVWMDGKPVILAGFEQSGKLDMWMDGRPVVRLVRWYGETEVESGLALGSAVETVQWGPAVVQSGLGLGPGAVQTELMVMGDEVLRSAGTRRGLLPSAGNRLGFLPSRGHRRRDYKPSTGERK